MPNPSFKWMSRWVSLPLVWVEASDSAE